MIIMSGSNISYEFTTLQNAVYQLLLMSTAAGEVYSGLGNAVQLYTEMTASGNFHNEIIAQQNVGGASWALGAMNQVVDTYYESLDQIEYEVNDSIARTEKDSSGDSDSVIGIARIVLKMKDLCHIIDVTRQLISRTQMTMEQTDAVIARLALEMHLKSPECTPEERAYIQENYAEVYSDITANITEEREKEEAAVADFASQTTVQEPSKVEEEVEVDE